MEVFYTVDRIQDVGQDLLRIKGTEQQFNEEAIIDIEFNDIPTSSVSAAAEYIKNIKEAVEQTIANRQTVKQEKKLVSLFNRVSDNINNDQLPGAIDQSLVDDLKLKVY